MITCMRGLFSSKWTGHWDRDVKHPSVPVHVGSKTWRDRDLETCNVTKIRRPGWWPRYEDARAAAERELELEGRNFSTSGVLLEDQESRRWYSEDEDILLRNISETALLVRAVSWVDRASQDTRVQAYISQSLPSIHRDLPKYVPECILRIRAVTLWCLISALRSDHFTNPHLALRKAEPGRDPQAWTTITALRKELGVTFDEAQRIRYRYKGFSPFRWPYSPYVTILCRMLPVVVECSMVHSGWANKDELLRRVCEWTSLWHSKRHDLTLTDWHINILRSMFSSPNHARTPNFPLGLCSTALNIALDRAKVSVNQEKQLGKDLFFV
jgi:hypothetical protein